MKKLIVWVLLAVVSTALAAAQTATLGGQVTHAGNGEALPGVTIFLPEIKNGTITDADGRYAMEGLPQIKTTVQVSYVGHQTIVETVDLRNVRELDFVMKESNAMMNEVVVTAFTGQSQLRNSPSPVSVVTQRELESMASTNIVDALAHQPGVAQITTGGAISKPVIRGLGHNRVAVVNDGIRQEGQQWGDEHGLEVDAQTVGSAEILKGPACLMYGSDAMAGVVVLHGQPVMPQGKMRLNLATEYQSNNGLIDYSIDFTGNKHGILWDARYSEKLAHAYKNKRDGYVPGSQFHERAASGMLGLNRGWGYSHLKLSYYHLIPGIVEGERDTATGELVRPDDAYDDKTYHKQLPFQHIHHYKATIDNSFYAGPGSVKLLLGYQQNRRQEHVESACEPGLDFKLHTVNYDARYVQTDLREWSLATGVNGMWQRSLNLGNEYLIPAYNLFDIGMYATLSRQLSKWSLSGGLRFDHRYLHSRALDDRFIDFTRHFNGVTGSVGAVLHVTDQMDVRANASRGFRIPNMSELASNGVHEGSLRYEVGNQELDPEYSWQFDLGWDFSSAVVSAQVSLFVNLIDNYIFLEKQADVITDGYDTYHYTSGDARLWGGEVSIDLHMVEPLHFENTFGYVNARLLHQPRDCRWLPMTPAPRWTSNLRYDIIRDGNQFNNLYASVEVETFLRQNHYYAEGGTETATPAYALLNASVGTDVKWNGRRVASVYLTGTNLLNKAYQSHLSRLKYADRNVVTGFRGVCNMGRNIGVKLLIPVEF